nr:TetR/AcrR family transcriptional regulator [Mammaliicoccus sp. Marseille-Q6498]
MKDTKTKIIEVSITEFSKKGYVGASLSSIASIIGIKKPSLYNHFNCKEILFIECINSTFKGPLEYAEQLIESNQTKEDLKEFLQKIVLNNHEHIKLYYQACFYPATPAIAEHVKNYLLKYKNEFRKAVYKVFEHEIPHKKEMWETYYEDIITFIDGWLSKRCYIEALSIPEINESLNGAYDRLSDFIFK